MTDPKPGRLESAVVLMLLFGIVCAFVIALALASVSCQPAKEHTYPRRALAQSLAHRQPDSVLARYAVVYGYQEASRAAEKRKGLPEAQRWFATINPTVTYEHAPEAWVYDLARYNIGDALHVAAYENGLYGVDWFLRDDDGNALGAWTDDNQWRALNLTDYCPRGVYGDTKGLTCLDYICGPLLKMATNETSRAAFDGYILEDGPPKHLWLYNWDADCVVLDERCVNKAGYIAAADSCRQRLLDDFVLAAGKRGFLMLTNGHSVLEDCPSYDPPMWDAFSGCKLERFGNWGGCPYDDLARWWEVYRGVEREYGPLHSIGQLDGLQGWDVSLCQIEDRGDIRVTGPDRMRHMRLMGGLSLMGDGAFSVSPYGNHHGGEPASIPPELDQPLGKALGPYQEANNGLLYREFENVEQPVRGRLERVRRRVTVNLTSKAISGVPAEDAVWEVVK